LLRECEEKNKKVRDKIMLVLRRPVDSFEFSHYTEYSYYFLDEKNRTYCLDANKKDPFFSVYSDSEEEFVRIETTESNIQALYEKAEEFRKFLRQIKKEDLGYKTICIEEQLVYCRYETNENYENETNPKEYLSPNDLFLSYKKLDDEFYHVICEYENEDDGRSDFDHVINVKIPIKDFESLINEHLLPYLNEKNQAILKNDDFSVHFHKTTKKDFKHYL
jgi:hypothetical protein